MIKLTQFSIKGLHGDRNFDIPIRDNKLILVGENGTGKSTVANFIYFVLTKTWWRMRDYDFESVSFSFGSEKHTITKSEIEILYPDEPDFFTSRHRLPPKLFSRLRNLVVHYEPRDVLSNRELMNMIRVETSLPQSIIKDYLHFVLDEDVPLFRENIRNISNAIDQILDSTILYLPTYRRIEKELSKILKNLDIDVDRRRNSRQLSFFEPESEETQHMELVEFGMRDVNEKISHKMQALKDSLTESLNNLTVRYLREVVFEDYAGVDASALDNIDSTTVENIFSRVGTDLLSQNEKRRIIDQINKNVHREKPVVAHFLIRLNEIYQKQREEEQDVEKFIEICNVYLTGKEMVYDSSRFEINVTQLPPTKHSKPIKLRDLSSGEKQIISLFSHIYLSSNKSFFVIIDEPELSLSVPWQKRFLPDILGTERCTGLIAVTHSPFIFDNELDIYTHSLERFTDIKE